MKEFNDNVNSMDEAGLNEIIKDAEKRIAELEEQKRFLLNDKPPALEFRPSDMPSSRPLGTKNIAKQKLLEEIGDIQSATMLRVNAVMENSSLPNKEELKAAYAERLKITDKREVQKDTAALYKENKDDIRKGNQEKLQAGDIIHEPAAETNTAEKQNDKETDSVEKEDDFGFKTDAWKANREKSFEVNKDDIERKGPEMEKE